MLQPAMKFHLAPQDQQTKKAPSNTHSLSCFDAVGNGEIKMAIPSFLYFSPKCIAVHFLRIILPALQ